MPKIIATYDYVDERGNLLYQKIRYKPKRFMQRRPEGNGDYIYDLDGVKPVLYRLPELLSVNGEYIFICEGEKDVDRLHNEGLTATTSGSNTSWKESFTKLLRNKKVVVLPDNDTAGRDYAKHVAQSLRRAGIETKVVRLPGLEDGEDISDWLNNGGSKKRLLKLVEKTPSKSTKKVKRTVKNRRDKRSTIETIYKGERNIRLTSEAGRLSSQGLESDEIEIQLLNYNKQHCKPPLEKREVKKIVKSTSKYDNTQSEKLNDVGNAVRFAKQHSDKLRFVWDWNRWVVYDGMRWNPKEGTSITSRLAKETARSIYKEAADCDDSEIAKAIASWANKSSSSYSMKAMLELARSERCFATFAEQFDKDDYLFNCLNGTVDLRTGVLQPHNPDDNITKLASVEYPAEIGEKAKLEAANLKLWLRCLEQWMRSDIDQIDYLQRLAGYCLTGDTTSRCFPVFHGSGKNGKSTFLDTLMSLMGDYAGKAPETLLKMSHYDRHPTEIADLESKRLVIASETKSNMRLKTALVKEMTGDRVMKARAMRQDFREFKVTHKTILMTQNLPNIEETSDAIWDRVHLIEWGYRVPSKRQDTHLLDKLKEEWDYILAWAVKGCLKWQRDRILKPTKKIEEATEVYRKQENPVGEFIDRCCKQKQGSYETNKKLWKRYEQFYADNKIRYERVSQVEFGRCLGQLGFSHKLKRINGKPYRCWIGLELK